MRAGNSSASWLRRDRNPGAGAGIGACVAIFAFVDAALLKPLPYSQPDRLDSVTESVAMIPRANLSYPDYLDWKSRNDVYSSLDVYNQRGYMLQTHEGVKLVHGARVSDGFFRTLGVKPVLGRDFYSGEDLPSAPHTVTLSYSGWQKWFGGRADIVGQSVTLSGDVYTVVGGAACRISVCSRRQCRILDDAARQRRLRSAPELPQPERRGAAERWRLDGEGRGGDEGHRRAVGATVSRLQSRTGRDD